MYMRLGVSWVSVSLVRLQPLVDGVEPHAVHGGQRQRPRRPLRARQPPPLLHVPLQLRHGQLRHPGQHGGEGAVAREDGGVVEGAAAAADRAQVANRRLLLYYVCVYVYKEDVCIGCTKRMCELGSDCRW